MTLLRRLLAPGRTRITTLLCALATLGAALTALVITAGPSKPPRVVAADLSGRPTACLAADATTAARHADTARIWAAMQQGAKGRDVNVQQLVLPATSAQAKPYLAGLLDQHCALVVTVGSPFGQAIPTDAHLSPSTHYMAFGAGLLPSIDTLTVLDGPDAASSAQAAVVALSPHD